MTHTGLPQKEIPGRLVARNRSPPTPGRVTLYISLVERTSSLVAMVPEPSTLTLTALGFAALVAWGWRRPFIWSPRKRQVDEAAAVSRQGLHGKKLALAHRNEAGRKLGISHYQGDEGSHLLYVRSRVVHN